MNQQERQAIKALIVATHGYYSTPIADSVIAMHVEDLDDLDFEKVVQGYKLYRRNPKNKFPPLPAAIRDLIIPAEDRDRDDSDDGRFVAAKILQAIKQFGFYRASEASRFMGELAWEVVQMQGGWQTLCMMEQDEIGIQQAQWRELASSLTRRARSGRSHTLPSLESKKPEPVGLIGMTELLSQMRDRTQGEKSNG